MKTKLFVLTAFPLIATACGSASLKSKSNIDNLVGDPKPTAKREEMVKDLERGGWVNEIVMVEKDEAGKTVIRPKPVKTKTSLNVYPETKPLVTLSVKSGVENTAVRERLSDSQKESLLASTLKTQSNLFQERQCFFVTINSPFKDAVDLKFWDVTLSQNSKSHSLKFEKIPDSPMDRGLPKPLKPDQLQTQTEVCSKEPIRINETFTLTFQPRYQAKLDPVTLEWAQPKPSNKIRKATVF